MKIQTARNIGKEIAYLLDDGKQEQAFRTLEPYLLQKIPFTHTGEIGRVIGVNAACPIEPFLQKVAATGAMGGWPIIGMALQTQIIDNATETLNTCRDFIIQGDTWYSTDILGERVPGPALLDDFDQTIQVLHIWRTDTHRWVRRAIGVTVHVWCKRTKGEPKKTAQAKQILELLQSLFGEQERDAVKGIGWGIKSMGKIYPELVSDWLINSIYPLEIKYRATMLNKAVEKLPDHLKAQVLESFRR